MHMGQKKKRPSSHCGGKKGASLFIAPWSHCYFSSFTSLSFLCLFKREKDCEESAKGFEFEDTEVKKWCVYALRAKALEIEATLLAVVKLQLPPTGHPRWPFGGMGMSLYLYTTIPYRHSGIES